MKRLRSMIVVLGLVFAVSSLASAQTNPFVGTWKLDVSASKFEPGPAPESQTRTWDAEGNIGVEGMSQSGKSASYSYTLKADGKPHPSGDTVPNGADTLTARKVSSHLIRAVFTRKGKAVEHTTYSVSKDGKMLVIAAKGSRPNGEAFSNEMHYEKQ
ncbi:MAG: hypothetical protein ACRD4Y_13290 [Candidatus Acidiferrales bacterium]